MAAVRPPGWITTGWSGSVQTNDRGQQQMAELGVERAILSASGRRCSTEPARTSHVLKPPQPRSA
jgi:hypothetical protein